jgi:hypothetical protein
MLGRWFEAYLGDVGHMFLIYFLGDIGIGYWGCINFDDDDVFVSVTIYQ